MHHESEAWSRFCRGIQTPESASGDADPHARPMRKAEGNSTAEFDSYAEKYEELLAHSIKISGERPEYFAAYKAAYLERLVSRDIRRVLDYGCGIGMLTNQLRLRFPKAQVDGFDPSPGSLARIDPVLLTQGSFESNPDFLGSAYDLIVMANVLHHVKPGERRDLVAEVASRLAPGGRLVVFEHNPYNVLMRWAVAQCVFDEDAILLRRKESTLYLTWTGLKATSDYIVFFPKWLRWFRRFEQHLSWCPMGAQYVAIGTRPL